MLAVLATAGCRDAGARDASPGEFARSVIHTGAEYDAAPHLQLHNWRPACVRRNGHCDYRTLAVSVSWLDMSVLVGMSALMLAITVVATYLPARRAAGVDPTTPLRIE